MTAWVFGYGSLLFRPGFPFEQKEKAVLRGYARRFHQGSPDHRGTPERPGRVVTLVREESSSCAGIAYRVADAEVARVFEELDVREQGGYARARVEVTLVDGSSVDATTWIAPPDNPHWLGPMPLAHLAAHVRASSGPSGANLEYVLRLDEVLVSLGIDDAHVRELAAHLRE